MKDLKPKLMTLGMFFILILAIVLMPKTYAFEFYSTDNQPVDGEIFWKGKSIGTTKNGYIGILGKTIKKNSKLGNGTLMFKGVNGYSKSFQMYEKDFMINESFQFTTEHYDYLYKKPKGTFLQRFLHPFDYQ